MKLSKKESWKRNQFYLKTNFELHYPSIQYIWDGRKWRKNFQWMIIEEQLRIEKELSINPEEMNKFLELAIGRNPDIIYITQEARE